MIIRLLHTQKIILIIKTIGVVTALYLIKAFMTYINVNLFFHFCFGKQNCFVLHIYHMTRIIIEVMQTIQVKVWMVLLVNLILLKLWVEKCQKKIDQTD